MINRLRGGNWTLLAGAIALAAVGCSNRETLDTVPVEGVVTLDGTPVEGAIVTFVPVTTGQGMSATGTTDASGTYRLTAAVTGELAAEPGAGTLPGEYMVGVRKAAAAAAPPASHEAVMQGDQTGPRPGENVKMDHLVPKKYNNPRQSGLTVTVSDGDNNIPIELTSN